MVVSVFSLDGDDLGDRKFECPPLMGDVLLLAECLMVIKQRRWSNDGHLEVIVDDVNI